MIGSGNEKILEEALRHCSFEPIHIPGSIQPHGVLLGIDPIRFKVVLTSENAAEYLGRTPEEVLGSDLARVAGGSIRDRIARMIDGKDLSQPHRFLASIVRSGGEWLAEASVHRRGPILILELEQADPAAVEATIELSDWIHRFSQAAGEVGPLLRFLESIAREFREVSGYDRTMIYRFHPDDHGEVIAESASPGLDPFLGLHYPASDIPRQARELYRRNRIRVLVDVHAKAVPLCSKSGISPAGPLDMTYCALRSVSPVHLEYLANMGVRASLVTSILQGDRLWGLLVCHHYSDPRNPSHALRAACTFLSEMISVGVMAHENRDRIHAQQAATDLLRRVLATIANGTDWMDAVLARSEDGKPPIASSGLAIIDGSTIRSVGTVPDEPTILEICAWLNRNRLGPIFSTDSLGESEPAFEGITKAGGILAVEIGALLPTYLIWFRQELIREITWGGEPHKDLVVGEQGPRLSPRKSFDAWVSTVLGRSVPWSSADLATATEIRSSVLEVVLLSSLLNKAVAEIDLVRTRSAVEASGEAILIADEVGRPRFANRAFIELFQATRDDLPERTIFAPISDPALGEEIVAATLGRGGSWRGEVEVVRPGLEPIPMALGIDTVVNKQGVTLGFIAIHFDLTERHRAHRELEEYSKRLEIARDEIEQQSALIVDAKLKAEAANLAKSNFLANMCHEIRTPMNGVIGLTELLLDTKLDDVQLNYARIIRASGDALMTLISDILDLSKIEAGRMIIVPTEFDFEELLKDLVSLLGSRAQQKGIRMSANLPVDFPRKLRGDAIRIRQILTNLAGNAIKFTNQGEVTIRGEVVHLTTTEATVRILVLDSGIGIPVEARRSIFESFTQGEAGNVRAAAGTGLGLTICRDLANLMGGRVEFVSEVGQGSTFWLEVTLERPADLPKLTSDAGVVTDPGPAEPPRRLRVLVAEDNPTNQLVARGLISRMGHEVVVVNNGLEAVEAHAQGGFDLILMDLQMPEMDGNTATIQIRNREGPGARRTPIIAATAYALEDERQRCLAAGMDAYITKPITVVALRAAFERFGPGARPS